MGDFNICGNFWDPNNLFHSIYSDLLIDIVDSMYLGLLFLLGIRTTIIT